MSVLKQKGWKKEEQGEGRKGKGGKKGGVNNRRKEKCRSQINYYDCARQNYAQIPPPSC